MNVLMHVAGVVAIFWMSSYFFVTVGNTFLGFVFVVVGVWAMVLTIMAINFDLGSLFGGKKEE